MNTYRPALEGLRSWDPMASEVACLAQMLYMHHRLDEPIDGPALDLRVGRMPGGVDMAAGVARVLLEEGFELLHVTGDNLHLLAADAGYLRDVLLAEQREDPDYLEQMLPVWTPIVQARAAARLDLYREYGTRAEIVTEPTSWAVVEDLASDGWHVLFSLVNSDGTTLAGVTVGPSDAGSVQVYMPTADQLLTTREMAGCDLAEGVVGVRLRL